MLSGKTVILGVTGSIAAYKAANLASMLRKQHADVQVIMTKNATEFINPITFETLTGKKCLVDTFDRNFQYEVEHVELAKRADLAIVAPASANVIAKLAHGIADDMLSTTAMACRAPLVIAPAMNTAMYKSAAVQRNIGILKENGAYFADPESGRLACGDTGEGKLTTTDKIIKTIYSAVFFPDRDFEGKKVLITAGATVERIDPVRYITNNSSGKMGVAIAEAAAMRGADVTLVYGKCETQLPYAAKCVSVTSAEDMYSAVMREAESADVVIKAAAVADYRPSSVAENKIKKGGMQSIELVQNIDILSELGKRYSGKKILVGFCMETENLLENAEKKLKSKGIDMIAANSLNEKGAGFESDTNIITLIDKDGTREKTEMCSKFDIANIILDRIRKKW